MFASVAALGSFLSDRFPTCSSSIVSSVRVIILFIAHLFASLTRSSESCHMWLNATYGRGKHEMAQASGFPLTYQGQPNPMGPCLLLSGFYRVAC